MTHPCLKATHRAQPSTTHTMIKTRRESERAQGRDAAIHWYNHLVYNIALFSPFLISHQNTALGISIHNERVRIKVTTALGLTLDCAVSSAPFYQVRFNRSLEPKVFNCKHLGAGTATVWFDTAFLYRSHNLLILDAQDNFHALT